MSLSMSQLNRKIANVCLDRYRGQHNWVIMGGVISADEIQIIWLHSCRTYRRYKGREDTNTVVSLSPTAK